MKRKRKRVRETTLSPLSPGNVDDFYEFIDGDGGSRSHKEGRKARQLCRQVAQTLDLVLSGDCRDELLQSLQVMSVVPAPNSSRLLVTVSANLPVEEFDGLEILKRLEQESGRLRAEVATSISRKRVPFLAYRVLGPMSSIL